MDLPPPRRPWNDHLRPVAPPSPSSRRFDDEPEDGWHPSWEPDRDHRLRTLVFLDGRLVDSRVGSVAGSAYAHLAEEADLADAARVQRAVRAQAPAPPLPPPHERVLRWLDDVVGGRVALMALDDDPLAAGPGAGADPVGVLVDRVCRSRFDAELAHAALTALSLLRARRDRTLDGSPASVAAGLCWLLGRANGRVGAGTPVTQSTLKQELGVTVQPSATAGRLRTRLTELLPHPEPRPVTCPDLLELGRADLLTGATRARLIELRDRALEVATRTESDAHARSVLGSTGD